MAESEVEVVFDRVGALARMGEDEDLLAEIVALFLGDIPVRLQELHAALAAKDAPQLERVAHGIKELPPI